MDTDPQSSSTISMPYRPDWMNRTLDAFARPPGSLATKLILLAVLLLAGQNASLWLEGVITPWGLHPGHTYIALLFAALPALVAILNRQAHAALAALRPALAEDAEPDAILLYRLTTAPARPAAIAAVGGATFVLLINAALGKPEGLLSLQGYPVSSILLNMMYVFAWSLFGTFLYHIYHQLRTIEEILDRQVKLDLFQVRPLFAFSRLTGLTAASLVLLLYGWVVLTPEILSDPFSIAIVLAITACGVAVFLLPLAGVHARLTRERDTRLDHANHLIETASAELHRRVEGGELDDMDEMYKALAGLDLERSLLRTLPTWPWQGDTLRLLVSALGLPLGLWLIQFFIGRLLGG